MSDQRDGERLSTELHRTKVKLSEERRNHRVFVWLVLWAIGWVALSAIFKGDFSGAACGWGAAIAAWFISGLMLPSA